MAYQPKSYRKFVATAATATLVATAVTPAFAAENLPFGDVNKNYAEAVGALYSKGIVNGVSKTEFGTYKPLKRGDAAVIIARALELDTKNAPDAGFKDVNSNIKGAVNALVAKGIISGVSKDKFDPDASLTRGQMAKILVNAFDLKDAAKETPFTDLTSTFKPYIEALYGANITGGVTKTTYGTNKNITRGDFAQLLYKAMNYKKPVAESIKSLDDITVDEGTKLEDVKLPDKVTVVYSDKSEKEASVKWDTSNLDTSKPGTYKLEGTVDGTNLKASVNVVVKAVAPKVESVSAINLRQVVVNFNKDVDVTTAGATDNYKFPADSGLTVTKADVNGKTVTLTVEGANQQQTADLTIDGVKSADGVDVGKTTQSVKFFDITAPTVSDVTAVGPKTIKVKFSEPLKSVPTFSLNDGTIAIVNTSFTSGDSEATLTLGTTPAEGSYNLKVSDGADFAGFKIDEVTKTFNFSADKVAPTLTVKSATPNQVVLSSNEDLTNVEGNNNLQFYHTYKGVDAYKATNVSVNGKEITLTFNSPLPEGPFKLFLSYADENGTKIADLWGNKVEAQTITGTVVADNVAPTVTKLEATSNTAINVTFSEDVSGATDPANYTIKDEAGKTVAINGEITKISGNTYSIPVSALNGGSYTVTIKNIKDTSINQNKLADYTGTVYVKDVIAPQVTDLDTTTSDTIDAQLLSDKKVKIAFSEAMDKDSIENKRNYLFNGEELDSNVKVTAVDNNQAVILDFTDVPNTSDQADPKNKTIQVLRVSDVAGNPIAAASTGVKVPNQVSAPLFDKAEATDKNTIKLYFKELITGAKASDFLVTTDDSNYNGVSSISNEVVDGKSVITLTTSDDIPSAVGNNVKVKTANDVSAVNSYGSKVTLGPTSVVDKYAPVATTAQALDNDDNGKVDHIEIKFSEDLYVPSVNDSDFTVDGYKVTSVNANGNTVTLTVEEKDNSDLTATPKVTLVGPVEDVARNVRSSQDAITAKSVSSADADAVAAAKAALAIGYASDDDANSVTQNLILPAESNGATITWESSDPSVVATDGKVTRPDSGQSDAPVTLTATIAKGSVTDTKKFTVTVKALP